MNNSSLIQRARLITQQVEDILRERIHKGIYPPDKRMPSEEHLAEELKVSRASIRTAMATLAAEGYITRRHGDGTYVQSRALEINLHPFSAWDIASQIQESGRIPSQRIIQQTQRPAQEWEASRLGLEDGEEVLDIQRLFFADGKPVALLVTVIRENALAGTIPADVANLSPFDFLEKLLRSKPRDGRIHFYAIPADEITADLLAIEPGQFLLKLDCLVFNMNGGPIIIDTEYYLGQDGFQMHLNLNQS